MNAISPGVYVTITPLDQYVENVPASTGFMAFFADKGPDNQLVQFTSLSDFVTYYGYPNYLKYGPQYGGGHLVAYQFAQVSPSFYGLRVLPSDATYSNVIFYGLLENPVSFISQTGTFSFGFDNNSGIMTVNVSGLPNLSPIMNPNTATNSFVVAQFNTTDPNVKLIVNQEGLMNVAVLGARSGSVATLPLQGGNGIISINEDNYISIHGSGTATISGTVGGQIIVYADIPDYYIADYSLTGVQTSYTNLNIEQVFANFQTQFRPKYILNDYVIEVGNQTSYSTYAFAMRPVLPSENGLFLNGLVVPDQANDGNYYVVNVVNGNLDIVPVTSEYQLLSIRPYQKIINGSLYNLTYNNQNGQLEWLQAVETYEQAWQQIYSWGTPLFGIFARYRGDYYNGVSFAFNQVLNKQDTWQLSIYEPNPNASNGASSSVLVNQFNVSFNRSATNSAGQSIYIEDVLNTYSIDLQFADYTSGTLAMPNSSYQQLVKQLTEWGFVPQAQVITNVSSISSPGWYYIMNNATLGPNPYNVDYTNYLGTFVLVRGDGFNYNQNYVTYSYSPSNNILNSEIFLFEDPIAIVPYILTPELNLLSFNLLGNSIIMNGINKYQYGLNRFLNAGSDGFLFENGQINSTVATQLLVQAYEGTIDPLVTNTEFVWIDLVFDGGYPDPVKNAIVELASVLRRDCMAIVDNGYNLSASQALQARQTAHSWNSEYVALYEPYIQIYDQFSGRNLWVSPIYAVAQLIALNDQVRDVWYAVAGYESGNSPIIQKIAYNPDLGDRDNFYLNQINPFVTFRDGTYLWGNLTTRRQADALQNVNVMRLILYCQRALSYYCRTFIFQPDDRITWTMMKKGISAFLTDVQNRRGLYSFNVNVYATELDILQKVVYADVTLFPIRDLEKVYLNFYVQ